jgi:serine/threonine-protein kinase
MMNVDELEPDEDVAPIRTGKMLGRYVLCFELANGGMATVHLARTESASGFDRLVALKIIHPHLAKQQEFVEMFLDEAKIAARIIHPNVCSVFDFGEQDGTYFLAMDYLVGETVNRVARAVWKRPDLAQRPSTLRVFARLIAEAAEGLHAAHEVRGDDGQLLGVVHRDVTPQNLFVGYDGSLRVVDFGVALAVGRSHHTAIGTLKGKYPYMSPEQVTQREDIDRRSDVWGLGVCLWEMLSGKRLFRQTSEFETLKAVTEATLPKPSVMNPRVPAVLDDIVMKALTRDRTKRFASARELSKALSNAIASLGGATASDVADLMDDLFSQEKREREVLMERARKLDPEHLSSARIVLRDLIAPPSVLPIPTSGPEPIEPIEPEAAPRRTLMWGALAALIALLFVGGAAMWSLGGSDADDTVTVTDPSPALVASTPPDSGPVEGAVEVAALPLDTGAPDAGAPARDAGLPPVSATGHHRAGEPHVEEVAPEGDGRLSVVTPPGWAELFIGPRRVGRSPIELTLPAGRYTVRIMPYGDGPAIERSVRVNAHRSARLVVRLDPP